MVHATFDVRMALLGGSWVAIIKVISPLIWVIITVTLLITLLITAHEPPSRGFRIPYTLNPKPLEASIRGISRHFGFQNYLTDT